MFSLSSLVIHTFEPISDNVVDNEIIIDDKTIWVATCQKDDMSAPTITNQMYSRLCQMYDAVLLKSKNPKMCIECQVSNFQEALELLDFMPLSEIFRNEYDDTDNDILDKDTEM